HHISLGTIAESREWFLSKWWQNPRQLNAPTPHLNSVESNYHDSVSQSGHHHTSVVYHPRTGAGDLRRSGCRGNHPRHRTWTAPPRYGESYLDPSSCVSTEEGHLC